MLFSIPSYCPKSLWRGFYVRWETDFETLVAANISVLNDSLAHAQNYASVLRTKHTRKEVAKGTAMFAATNQHHSLPL